MTWKVVPMVLALGLAGCRSSSPSLQPSDPPTRLPVPSGPASPPLSGPVPPVVVSSIRGYVSDTAFRPIPGARVEVLDGPETGLVATADDVGQVSLWGTFDSTTRFRATHEGHVAATEVFRCSVPNCERGAEPWLRFSLDLLVPAVDLAGDYTVTFTADSACADLPGELRTRAYSATITPGASLTSKVSTNALMYVTLTGASFLGSLRGFPLGVAGNYADFWLHGGHDPAIVEQVGVNAYLLVSGNAEGIVNPGAHAISMPLDGWVDYCVLRSPLGAPYLCGTDSRGVPNSADVVTFTHCESQHHQLTLTRR